MAQNPNDPRVQEYYRQQRLAAEGGAARGDAGAQQTLASIGQKLQGGNAQQRQVGNVDLHLAGKKSDAAKAAPVDQDPIAMLADPAAAGGSVLRHILTHPAALAKIAEHVGGMVAKHLFPDAEAGAEEAAGSTGAHLVNQALKKKGARVVGKANVERPALGSGKSMKNVTPQKVTKRVTSDQLRKGQGSKTQGEFARAASAAGRKKDAIVKGAIARKGTKSSESIASKGGDARKALPKGGATGKATKGTPRQRGTNPRKQVQEGPGSNANTKRGTNPRATGTNPRAKTKKKD